MKPAALISVVLGAVIGLIGPMIPTIGGQALDVAERAASVPEKDVDRLTSGMAEEDKLLVRKMFRKLADVVSDIVVFVTSRGKIRPDGESDYSKT